ncbi:MULTISPECIES: DUF6768 family protein [Pseudoalteromonas]|uniref:Uncharacterized protein n=1 Tax=Pseudoalteromonas rubra TaxID=43658 RepID=A0A0U3I2J1_9GAMM|nr:MULTISPECIES: DUF6768 family protein [Pseudoalteromonas]ALU41856.1 hypothetical protein AT705_02300 [Pseudoalteromonas rubra]
MNLDKEISKALQQEQNQIDPILAQEKGLFTMLGNVYQGNTRFWVILASISALLITIGFVYSGYRFYIATAVMDQVFWAVWFITGLLVQIATKLWIFMEMNRQSVLREIAHLAVRLQAK